MTLPMLEGTVLRNLGGQPVTLGHVARVEPDFEDIGYFSRINGENVISLNITKRSGQNSIAVSRRLRARAAAHPGRGALRRAPSRSTRTRARTSRRS